MRNGRSDSKRTKGRPGEPARVFGYQPQPDPAGIARNTVRAQSGLASDDGSARHALERRYHQLGYDLDEPTQAHVRVVGYGGPTTPSAVCAR